MHALCTDKEGKKRSEVETLHAGTLQSLSWSNRRLSSPGMDSSVSILTRHSRKKRKAAKHGWRLSSIQCSSNVEPVNTTALPLQMECASHQYTCSFPATMCQRGRCAAALLAPRWWRDPPNSTVAPLLWLHYWLMAAEAAMSRLLKKKKKKLVQLNYSKRKMLFVSNEMPNLHLQFGTGQMDFNQQHMNFS